MIRSGQLIVIAVAVGAAVILATGCAATANLGESTMATATKSPSAVSTARIVNLGDSITDGQTYALLVEQALREAGKPVPRFIGEGIGGDTSAGMLQRLDRDVFPHKPTMVMLNCGINDLATGVKLDAYEATVTAIAERMKAEKVTLMLLTTTNLRSQEGGIARDLETVNAVLRKVAAKYDFPLAEVHARMQEGRAKEKDLWENDGCHLNFAGYRYLSRAVLDALGYPDVPVPTELRVNVLPGVIPNWKILPLLEARPPLDEKTVAEVKVDGAWKDYALPETQPADGWWWDQERRRGVAVGLQKNLGPAKGFIAVAEITEAKARSACLNFGGSCGPVWLNGKRIFGPGLPAKGWHPGGYRFPVELRQGQNRVVVETDGRFFVSLTDTADW